MHLEEKDEIKGKILVQQRV